MFLLLAVLSATSCSLKQAESLGQGQLASDAATAVAQKQDPAVQATSSGQALYEANCAACHDQPFYKAPSRGMIRGMGVKGILRAMNTGAMMAQASALDEVERVAVAEYVSGQSLADVQAQPRPPLCDAQHQFDARQVPVSRGWGVDLRNTRFQPEPSGGLTADNADQLEVKWVFAYPNAFQARSQPIFGGGAIYVGSQDGTVWALDAQTGCLRWSYQASAEVRTGIVITPWSKQDLLVQPTLYFGDMLANVYAVDAITGELRWRVKAHEHRDATLTGTPTYHAGRLFVSVSSLEVIAAADPNYECCTFQGTIVSLDANSGATLWRATTTDELPSPAGQTIAGTTILAPSGAPVWSAPTIDVKRNQLYVGTGENYSSPADGNSDAIIAFNLDTGEKLWVSQQTKGDAWNVACFVNLEGINRANCPKENGPDYDFGANPMLLSLDDGQEVVVAGQKSGDVVAIDPDSGATLWKTRIGRGGVQGGVHFGLAAQDHTVYVPINDLVFAEDDLRYDSKRKAEPGVHAVDARTGERVWSAQLENVCGDIAFCSPGVSHAITAIPGAVIAGYLDGHLRIHSRADGRVLWQRNMLGEYTSVSGAKATGGAFSGGGVLVANGYLYANAGYGFNLHIPGNALVALGLKGSAASNSAGRKVPSAEHEIAQLQHRYANATDMLVDKEFAGLVQEAYKSIFTSDAKIGVGDQMQVIGPLAWLEVVRQTTDNLRSSKHVIGQQTVELHALPNELRPTGSATLRSALEATQVSKTGALTKIVGTYVTRAVYDASGQWRIAEMNLQLEEVETGTLVD